MTTLPDGHHYIFYLSCYSLEIFTPMSNKWRNESSGNSWMIPGRGDDLRLYFPVADRNGPREAKTSLSIYLLLFCHIFHKPLTSPLPSSPWRRIYNCRDSSLTATFLRPLWSGLLNVYFFVPPISFVSCKLLDVHQITSMSLPTWNETKTILPLTDYPSGLPVSGTVPFGTYGTILQN